MAVATQATLALRPRSPADGTLVEPPRGRTSRATGRPAFVPPADAAGEASSAVAWMPGSIVRIDATTERPSPGSRSPTLTVAAAPRTAGRSGRSVARARLRCSGPGGGGDERGHGHLRCRFVPGRRAARVCRDPGKRVGRRDDGQVYRFLPRALAPPSRSSLPFRRRPVHRLPPSRRRARSGRRRIPLASAGYPRGISAGRPATGGMLARIDGAAGSWHPAPGSCGRFADTRMRTGRLVRIDTQTHDGRIGTLTPWADLTVAAGAVWASSPRDGTIRRLDPSPEMRSSGSLSASRPVARRAYGRGRRPLGERPRGVIARYDIADDVTRRSTSAGRRRHRLRPRLGLGDGGRRVRRRRRLARPTAAARGELRFSSPAGTR